jgi:hypothetical protein
MIPELRSYTWLLLVPFTAAMLMGAAGSVVDTDATRQIRSSEVGTLIPLHVVDSALSATTVSKSSGTSGIGVHNDKSARSAVTATVKSNGSHIVQDAGTILSPYAEELARTIKFDRQILVIAKEEAQSHIQRLVGYDENNYQIMALGIEVSVPEDRTDRVLASLRKKLSPLKYLAFVVEMNAGLKMDKIGVINGVDQYEILRIMHTDGDEYDIANQDVIDRLKEWEKVSAFDIIGAGSDWVELEFLSVPKDLRAFAEDVYEFCPDAVDQGPESVEGLQKEIMKTNRLFLLWD